jgi:drug/metabolite transporter (DMT)-like permease
VSTPRRTYVFLVIGLVAASQSGNLIRIGDAHPVAIAAWRLLIATALLAPLAGRGLSKVRRLGRTDLLLLLVGGAALATHFFAWIAAVQHTTVANAAMSFAVNPVLTATAAHLLFKEKVSRRLALSIAVGIAGVGIICWGDLRLSADHLYGDGLALLCSALFTVYFLTGKRLRRRLDTTTYVTVLYGVAALVSFTVLVALDLPVIDYDERNWLCFFSMALVPTMIGHTSFNNALQYIDAGRISTATLSEPLLAGLVAYLAWDEPLAPASLVGYAFICASVVLLVTERRT